MQIYKKLAMVCEFSFVDIAKMHALGAQTVGSYALCVENAAGAGWLALSRRKG